jgi:hypothetical protein
VCRHGQMRALRQELVRSHPLGWTVLEKGRSGRRNHATRTRKGLFG